MSDGTQRDCAICGIAAFARMSSRKIDNGDYEYVYHYECPRCGRYDAGQRFDTLALEENDYLQEPGSRKRANLSAWIRERTDRGQRPVILEYSFLLVEEPNDLRDAFEAAGSPRFHEKADKLLLAIERQTIHAGHHVYFPKTSGDINRLPWLARAWAINSKEFVAIKEYLGECNRILGRRGSKGDALTILPAGWARIEELASTSQASSQGFVAMWFEPEIDFLYENALAPAIRAAGYAPRRIDRKATAERIDDQIEVEIKKSKFVVADATGHRGGVYYEAGFARGQKMPVFWSCHTDDFEELHFDVKQFPCFKWDCYNLEELSEDLRWRIENICGRGPVKHKEAN